MSIAALFGKLIEHELELKRLKEQETVEKTVNDTQIVMDNPNIKFIFILFGRLSMVQASLTTINCTIFVVK